MAYGNIIFERTDGAAWITINRPPHNILDIATMKDINNALAEVERDNESKAVIIRGAGNRAFSAGVDVKDHLPEKMEEMVKEFENIFHWLIKVGRPTIAAVDGMCLGGGCEVALFCDMVIATEKAQFGQPEIKLAVFPGLAVAALPRIIPRKKAFEMIITGDSVDAREAERMGLVNKVVPEDKLDEEVRALLRRLTDKSLVALKLTRYALYSSYDLEFHKALGWVNDIYRGILMSTEDANEGLKSFLEKRKPVWKGR